MKDINEISQTDKDNLYQTYTDLLNIPEHWYKEAKEHFYKCILKQDPMLMPYFLVIELKKLGYIALDDKI